MFSTAFIGYYYTVITLLLHYFTTITWHTWLCVTQLFSWPYDGLTRTSGWPSSMRGGHLTEIPALGISPGWQCLLFEFH